MPRWLNYVETSWHFYFPFIRMLNRLSEGGEEFVKLLINRLTNHWKCFLNTSNNSKNCFK